MADVVGQDQAIERATDALRAGKSVLLVGPPAAGRTMIARRLPGVLPLMSQEEILESSAIHSAAGLLSDSRPAVIERPFRAPHYTVSDAGLLGGGRVARPGEATLATHGVLFLDEVHEFRRSAIDALFGALRAGHVRVGGEELPTRPLLVASATPCACGGAKCCCSPGQLEQFARRLEPIKARFDVVIEISPRTRSNPPRP